MPLPQSLATPFTMCVLALPKDTYVRVLPRGPSLASKGGLVDLEGDGVDESDVRGDTVADGKGDEVARQEGIGKRCEWVTIAVETSAEGSHRGSKRTGRGGSNGERAVNVS